MKVFLLAADFGSQASNKSLDTMLLTPIADRPFLEWQLLFLKAQGFADIVLCHNSLASEIADYFGNGEKLGLNINYLELKDAVNVAGVLNGATELISDTSIIVHANPFFDVDYQGLIDFHEGKEAMLSLALAMRGDASRFGAVRIDLTNRVTNIAKEQPDDVSYGYVNSGIYVIEPTVLDFVNSSNLASFEYEVIPEIIERKTVFGYISDSYLIDINNQEGHKLAQKYFAQFR